MKRTTIVLEDDLFRRIKQEAARQGETLKSTLNALLRRALSRPKAAKPYRLNWKPVKGLLKPGVDVADRKFLIDLLGGRW